MPLVDMNQSKGFTKEEMNEMESAPEATPVEAESETDPREPSEPTAPEAVTREPPSKTAPKGYVPAQALHEAREEAKAAKATAQRAEAMWNKFLAERKAEQAAEEERQRQARIPAFQDDPAGHLYAKTAEVDQKLQKFEQAEAQRLRAEAEEAQTKRMADDYAASVAAYVKTPEGSDFQAAYTALYKARDAELAALAQVVPQYADATGRMNQIQYEEGLIVGQALMRGVSPAKVLHDMARQRGYKPETSAKIETLAAGQKAAKSLNGGGVPAASSDQELSLAHMLHLEDTDPAAAEAAWAKLKKLSKGGR